MEAPIDKITDIDYTQIKILLAFDEANKLSFNDQASFANLAPSYKSLSTNAIKVNNGVRENI